MYWALLFVAMVTSASVAGNLDTVNHPVLWLVLVVNALLLGFSPKGIMEAFDGN